jgi:general stress protein 26
MGDQAEEVGHVAELIDRAGIGRLTTVTEFGKHVSRPMALQKVEFDGDLWLFCYDDSAEAVQIRSQPEVNVSLQTTSRASGPHYRGKRRSSTNASRPNGCGPAR